MTPPRNPVRNPVRDPDARTMPGRNGGTLRVGGTNPNAGRPRDAVRAAMLGALDNRLPRLIALADCGEPAVELRALDLLARYGLGTSNELDSRIRDERTLTREEREERVLALLQGIKK